MDSGFKHGGQGGEPPPSSFWVFIISLKLDLLKYFRLGTLEIEAFKSLTAFENDSQNLSINVASSA